MPTITGSITISDLLDGVTGISVILSNESHTFIADADGKINTTGDDNQLNYDTDIMVFAGADEYTYTTAASLTSAETWRINGTITFTPDVTISDLSATVTAVASPAVHANLTLFDLATDGRDNGFVDANTTTDSVVMSVPIQALVPVMGGPSRLINVVKTVSLTKAKGGDAKIMRLTASNQSIEYAFASETPKVFDPVQQVVFTATTLNFGADPEAVTWTKSINGGTFSAVAATEGTQSGTDNKILTVSATQFDNAINQVSEAAYVTYRATAESVFDQVTVFLLRDAEGGYQVLIEVTEGVQVFKNDPTYDADDMTTYCDLQAGIFRGGIDISTDSSVSYQWQVNGVNAVLGTNISLSPQPSGYGVTERKIRIIADDVSDNGTDRFSNAVTF